MKRRTALKIVALSALTPAFDGTGAPFYPGREGAAWSAGDYTLRFFTAEENEMLDRLMEMIIPADAHSPGAHAAQVSLFADLIVATSGSQTQEEWRAGLQRIREEAAKSSLESALARAAAHEGRPVTELDRFFQSLKQMTVNGYYTSAIGIHQDLQYQGNTYLAEFPGCTIKTVGFHKTAGRGQERTE
jgi:hypothetical protein